MEISSVNNNEAFSLSGNDSTMGKKDFLELLVTQLQNQDPLDPVKNEDFAAQLAQFSALEQMENLNTSFTGFMQLSQVQSASSMIGREVEWKDADSITQSGVVEKISITANGMNLIVNGQAVPVDRISEVREPAPTQP